MAITLAHEYLTVSEAATILRVSPPTIYRRCADGRLEHIRVGGGDGPIRVLASAVLPDSPLERRAPGSSVPAVEARAHDEEP